MTDNSGDDSSNDSDSGGDNWRKQLEASTAQEVADAKAETAGAQRENAFLKAGIDPENPKQRYFYKAYEGDMTVEAIRAAAIKDGFQDAVSEADKVEGDAIEAFDAAVSGGETAPVADAAVTKWFNDLEDAKQNYDDPEAVLKVLQSPPPGVKI